MKFKNSLAGFFTVSLITVLIFSSCKDDKTNTPHADLHLAKLEDFPLTEVDYLEIEITHPEIEDEEETKSGEINITIPHLHQSMILSLKEFALDEEKYSISPAVGEVQNFSGQPVTYTITSVLNPDKEVHYIVRVIHGGEPLIENHTITDVKFESSKNSFFTETIDALKIVEYENYSTAAIYMIVPAGTDFSSLTPTITFDAAKLYYQVNGEFKPYPNGTALNFKYPNRVYIQVENSLGEKSKIYEIVVDVMDPLVFETDPVALTGDGTAVATHTGVIKWTNVGNHPITGMAAHLYKDKIYPVEGYDGDVNIITSLLSNPIGGTPGVLPGESGEVTVMVARVTPITGVFSSTVVFKPIFNFETGVISAGNVSDRKEDLFEMQPLVITVNITE